MPKNPDQKRTLWVVGSVCGYTIFIVIVGILFPERVGVTLGIPLMLAGLMVSTFIWGPRS